MSPKLLFHRRLTAQSVYLHGAIPTELIAYFFHDGRKYYFALRKKILEWEAGCSCEKDYLLRNRPCGAEWFVSVLG